MFYYDCKIIIPREGFKEKKSCLKIWDIFSYRCSVVAYFLGIIAIIFLGQWLGFLQKNLWFVIYLNFYFTTYLWLVKIIWRKVVHNKELCRETKGSLPKRLAVVISKITNCLEIIFNYWTNQNVRKRYLFKNELFSLNPSDFLFWSILLWLYKMIYKECLVILIQCVYTGHRFLY